MTNPYNESYAQTNQQPTTYNTGRAQLVNEQPTTGTNRQNRQRYIEDKQTPYTAGNKPVYVNPDGSITSDGYIVESNTGQPNSFVPGHNETDYEYFQRVSQLERSPHVYANPSINKYRPETFGKELANLKSNPEYKQFLFDYYDQAANNPNFVRYKGVPQDAYQSALDMMGMDDIELEAAYLFTNMKGGLDKPSDYANGYEKEVSLKREESINDSSRVDGDDDFRARRGESDRGTTIVDDYSEYPEEIRNKLEAYDNYQREQQQLAAQQEYQGQIEQLKSVWGISDDTEFAEAFAEVQQAFNALPPDEQLKYDNLAGANYLHSQIKQERQSRQSSVPQFQRSTQRTAPRQQATFTQSQLDTMSTEEYARRNNEIIRAYQMGLVDFNS